MNSLFNYWHEESTYLIPINVWLDCYFSALFSNVAFNRFDVETRLGPLYFRN